MSDERSPDPWAPYTVPRVQVIDNHHGEDNAFHQPDYPYGLNARCERWVWVETAHKGQGAGRQRFVARTKDPATGRMNRPRASTYTDMVILYVDPATGYVQYHGVSSHLGPAYDARLRLDGTLYQLTEARRGHYDNLRAMAQRAAASTWRQWETIRAAMVEEIFDTGAPPVQDPQKPWEYRTHYLAEDDWPWAVADARAEYRRLRCATAGCRRRATHAVEHGPDDDRVTERCCTPCAEGYGRRPALRAKVWPLKG